MLSWSDLPATPGQAIISVSIVATPSPGKATIGHAMRPMRAAKDNGSPRPKPHAESVRIGSATGAGGLHPLPLSLPSHCALSASRTPALASGPGGTSNDALQY